MIQKLDLSMNASSHADEDFRRRLDFAAEATEATLTSLLGSERLPDEIVRPSRLLEAMRYAS
ncbi:MAG: polyprenyl synthetase family protein, partial [Methylocystis sp.]